MKFSEIISTEDQYEVAKAKLAINVHRTHLLRYFWSTLIYRIKEAS